MHFTFVHPEFFVWMLPPVLILFFFWFTQKSAEFEWLDPKIIERLRAKNSTMSLRSRNILFLIAAVLMITALAQPVIYHELAKPPRLKVLIVMDLSSEQIETSKALSLGILKRIQGDEVGVVSKTSLIAPPTRQYQLLQQLILQAGVENKASSEETAREFSRQYRFDTIIKGFMESPHRISDQSLKAETEKILQELQRQKEEYAYRDHIPLFSYPLGLAMLLILIALSSKSARKSVSVELFLVFMFFAYTPSEAVLMDFRLLNEAEKAYKNREYHTSLKKFKTYQKMHDSPQIRYNIANVYYRMGRFDEALRCYETVKSDNEMLMRYRDENMQRAVRYASKAMGKKNEPIENKNQSEQKKDHPVVKKETLHPRVYPLKNFLD